MKRSVRVLIGLSAALALMLAGCSFPLLQPAPRVAGAPELATGLNGAVLEPVRPLPELSLQQTNGKRFASANTAGRLSLFFFGYTFCPDVCPLTLLHVAQARRELGEAARYVDVYFVTVDPERDTVERLAAYVPKFDPAIIGATGTPDELARVYQAFGVTAQKRVIPESAAGYFVDHSAGSTLVDADGRIRLMYPYGTPPAEVAADLKTLLAERSTWRESPPASPAPPRIEQAWARAAERGVGQAPSTSAVYLTALNDSLGDEVLLGVSTDAALAAELHESYQDNGVMRMRPVSSLPLPAQGKLTLQPGGLHIMLIGLQRDLPPDSKLDLTLHFQRAGDVQLAVPVRKMGG